MIAEIVLYLAIASALDAQNELLKTIIDFGVTISTLF